VWDQMDDGDERRKFGWVCWVPCEGGAWCEKMVGAEKGREIATAFDEHSRKSLLLDGDLKKDRQYRWRI
jgi:hypothetical protein